MYANMNKQQLRAACKQVGIAYGKLSVDQMRAALANREAPAVAKDPVAAAIESLPAKTAQDSKVVTDGIKIEKNRDEANGVKRPSKGGVTHRVWLTVEALHDTLGRWPDRSEAISACVAQDINPATAATQYMLCRRFHGVLGRLPKVAAAA